MVATRQVTVEEFAEMPLQGIWELVDGEPIELSPAAGRSGWISGMSLPLLANHVRQASLGWAFPAETGFVLFEDRQTVRSPDAAVVLRDRLAAAAGQLRAPRPRSGRRGSLPLGSHGRRDEQSHDVSSGRGAAGLARRSRQPNRHRVPPKTPHPEIVEGATPSMAVTSFLGLACRSRKSLPELWRHTAWLPLVPVTSRRVCSAWHSTASWELIDGELAEVTPSADESSSTRYDLIGLLLGPYVRPAGLGPVYGADGGFVLFPDRETVLVPDVAFVRAERAPPRARRARVSRAWPPIS